MVEAGLAGPARVEWPGGMSTVEMVQQKELSNEILWRRALMRRSQKALVPPLDPHSTAPQPQARSPID
jgi:hypothetical protein